MNNAPEIHPLVLLVDDDPDTRDMYGVALTLSGFRTAAAGTAAEARQAVRALQPAIVVTDIMLPDGDGCQLCEELSRDPATRAIPKIALTGRSGDEEIARCTAAGCARVLVKPCPPERLAEIIREVLGTPRQQG